MKTNKCKQSLQDKIHTKPLHTLPSVSLARTGETGVFEYNIVIEMVAV
jgi:hypothetical protein